MSSKSVLLLLVGFVVLTALAYLQIQNSSGHEEQDNDSSIVVAETNPTTEPADTILIVHAWYGVPERIEDSHGGQVKARLRSNIVENGGRLVIAGDLNHFFGFDPAPNDEKQAAIHLRYNGKDYNLRVTEGQVFQFPEQRSE
jgi:hypothetical protein